MQRLFLLNLFLLPLLFYCATQQKHTAKDHDFQDVDTKDKPIEYQVKKTYSYEPAGIYFDNKFPGARINDVDQVNDSTYKVYIKPENEPINPSPWYAFRLWSKNDTKEIYLDFDYGKYKHRYLPKISKNGSSWITVDSSDLFLADNERHAKIKIRVPEDTVWIAAQEIASSKDVSAYLYRLSNHADASTKSIGTSAQGRNLLFLDISKGKVKNKETVVIFGRQHPPEVTGYFAMQAFVEEVLSGTELAEKFRERFRVMVFPLLNPDGVDQGHWRHNTGGVDLNRDWAHYRQPEIRTIADFIVSEAAENNNKVVLGLDFHSTFSDVFYTNKNVESVIPDFKDAWLNYIEEHVPDNFRESPSEPKTPVSKSWFYAQFGAEGVVYEIGDNTPRELIRKKGKISAQQMMRLLLGEGNGSDLP